MRRSRLLRSQGIVVRVRARLILLLRLLRVNVFRSNHIGLLLRRLDVELPLITGLACARHAQHLLLATGHVAELNRSLVVGGRRR